MKEEFVILGFPRDRRCIHVRKHWDQSGGSRSEGKAWAEAILSFLQEGRSEARYAVKQV